MASIDIFNVEPHVVSNDMSGKTFLIYGQQKTGKTTVACQFPQALLMAFEKGYSMLPGVKAIPINSWGDATIVRQQLIKNMKDFKAGKVEAPAYKTVIIDTADIAWDMCEKFVAAQADVTYSDEIGYGKGPNRATLLFDDFFNALAKAGYALVVISHDKMITQEIRGQEVVRIVPSLKDRPRNVVCSMVDIIAYAYSETKPDGSKQMMLRMREGDNIEAGSRTKYTSEVIPFTYDALMADIAQATQKIAEESGLGLDEKPNNMYESEKVSFKDLKTKIGALTKTLRANNYGDKYTAVVEKHLGKDKLVRDCSEAQTDVLRVILDELESTIEELGLLPEK